MTFEKTSDALEAFNIINKLLVNKKTIRIEQVRDDLRLAFRTAGKPAFWADEESLSKLRTSLENLVRFPLAEDNRVDVARVAYDWLDTYRTELQSGLKLEGNKVITPELPVQHPVM